MRRRLILLFGCFVLPASLAHCGGDDFQAGDEASSAAGASGGSGPSSGGGASGAASSAASGSGAACGQALCAPLPPSDWKGPARLLVGDVAAGSCVGFDEELAAHVPPLDAPATCESCSCGSPEGITCSTPMLQAFSTANCSTTPSNKAPTSGTCVALGGYGAKAANSTPSGGGCQVAGGQPSGGSPTWAAAALLCSKPSATTDCRGGVCVPQVPGMLDDAACVHREGDEPECPDGYPARQVLYLDIADDRDCSACTCGAPSGASCINAVTSYPTVDCQGQAFVIPGDGQCYPTEGHNYGAKFDANAATGGICQAAGGEPMGAATPAGPVTVCCTK